MADLRSLNSGTLEKKPVREPDARDRHVRNASWRDALLDPFARIIPQPLTREQKQNSIANQLKINPKRPNRQIAKDIGVDHKTVGSVRAEMENRGEIPHVESCKDTRGRQQPVKRNGGHRHGDDPHRGTDHSDAHGGTAGGNVGNAAIARRIKLRDELPKIGDTNLNSPKELDALITLKEINPHFAAELVDRAARGEAVSATAEIATRKFEPRPDAAVLIEKFNRHSHPLLRDWIRASPAERRRFIKYLEENADRDTPPFLRREAAAGCAQEL